MQNSYEYRNYPTLLPEHENQGGVDETTQEEGAEFSLLPSGLISRNTNRGF